MTEIRLYKSFSLYNIIMIYYIKDKTGHFSNFQSKVNFWPFSQSNGFSAAHFFIISLIFFILKFSSCFSDLILYAFKISQAERANQSRAPPMTQWGCDSRAMTSRTVGTKNSSQKSSLKKLKLQNFIMTIMSQTKKFILKN